MRSLNSAINSPIESPDFKKEYIAKETIDSHITKRVGLMYLSINDPERSSIGMPVNRAL